MVGTIWPGGMKRGSKIGLYTQGLVMEDKKSRNHHSNIYDSDTGHRAMIQRLIVGQCVAYKIYGLKF